MSENVYTEFWKGQLLELLTPNKETYFTQIIKHENDLLIQRPVNRKNLLMSIEDSTSVTVYFQDDMKGLCTFNSKIYEPKKGNIVIKKPSTDNVKKTQRRRFFRVQASVDLHLVLPPIKNANHPEKLSTVTHDIS